MIDMMMHAWGEAASIALSTALVRHLMLSLPTLAGPEDTPWEGGIFSLRITFTERYPDKPPKVRFLGEMFHPNVYADGNLCLDLLQDQWSPCHNICTLLTSIQSLLTDPNCTSPANPEAAQLYTKDRPAFNKKVRKIAQRSVEG